MKHFGLMYLPSKQGKGFESHVSHSKYFGAARVEERPASNGKVACSSRAVEAYSLVAQK